MGSVILTKKIVTSPMTKRKRKKTTNPTESDYSGFLMFPQKYCGPTFIDAVNDGEVKVDFYEAGDLITLVGDSFKREEQGKQSATIQFMVNKGEGDTMKGKADQFWMSI